MLNTYIYHQLTAICFSICYTIFSKTIPLFIQEVNDFCKSVT